MQGKNEAGICLTQDEMEQLLHHLDKQVIPFWKLEQVSYPANLLRFTSPDGKKVVSYFLPLRWWKRTDISFTKLGENKGEIEMWLAPWEGRERNKQMAKVRATLNREIEQDLSERLKRQVQNFIKP